MTGVDVQSYVESRLGTDVEPDQIIEAVNECLGFLGDDSLVYDTIEITDCDPSTSYSLPEDFTFVEKVLMEDNVQWLGWAYRTGEIRFSEEAEGEDFTIVARRIPEEIDDISDTIPDIHRLYHLSIKLYAYAWIQETENPAEEIADKFYQKSMEMAQKAAQTLLRTKEPAEVTVIRHA